MSLKLSLQLVGLTLNCSVFDFSFLMLHLMCN